MIFSYLVNFVQGVITELCCVDNFKLKTHALKQLINE